MKNGNNTTDDADTRLLMGRVDNQESASVIDDGLLRTNIGTRDEEDAAGIRPCWRLCLAAVRQSGADSGGRVGSQSGSRAEHPPHCQ